jgi:imidazolonepropionase-like amidohydrolase
MSTVFTNVRIFDGTGAAPFEGAVRIDGARIATVSRGGGNGWGSDGEVIDGHGATLMPGLIESHAHLTWPSSVERFVPGMSLPIEDMTLNTARNARILLDHGFTSAYSAGALSKSIETTLKKVLDEGAMPGPRLIPSSIERQPPNTTEALQMKHHAETRETGPEAVRSFVKECAAIGAKAVKFLLSGESALKPGSSMELLYTDEEVKAAGEQARESGVWLTAHCHAPAAIKQAVRNGFRMLYHCTYADAEAIDLLEQHRDRLFVGPTIGIAQATLDAKPPPHFDMTHMKQDATTVIEHQSRLMPELKRRGVRLLPGGDYGFPFNPNGRNARDLELFMRYFGFSAGEALHAGTQLGAELIDMGGELGQVRAGFIADLLLVDGDPTADITLLQNKQRLLGIMQSGRFYKRPPATP